MSTAIRAPGLGPIIGHTTATSCRVWIRTQDSGDDRTIGVAVLQTAAGHRLYYPPRLYVNPSQAHDRAAPRRRRWRHID